MATFRNLDLVKTELKVGITFSKLAMRARHPDKYSRNRNHAQAAYDAALRFFQRGDTQELAAESGGTEIRQLFDELKANLARLGEAPLAGCSDRTQTRCGANGVISDLDSHRLPKSARS